MTSDEDKDWVDGVAASYDFVRFTLSDIHGISRCKLVPRRHVDDTLKTGLTLGAGIVCGTVAVAFFMTLDPGHT